MQFAVRQIHPEGRLLLRDLNDFATQSASVYRHAWRPGDLVIWDNRCTMHRATPFASNAHKREMRRTTIIDMQAGAAAA